VIAIYRSTFSQARFERDGRMCLNGVLGGGRQAACHPEVVAEIEMFFRRCPSKTFSSRIGGGGCCGSGRSM